MILTPSVLKCPTYKEKSAQFVLNL